MQKIHLARNDRDRGYIFAVLNEDGRSLVQARFTTYTDARNALKIVSRLVLPEKQIRAVDDLQARDLGVEVYEIGDRFANIGGTSTEKPRLSFNALFAETAASDELPF